MHKFIQAIAVAGIIVASSSTAFAAEQQPSAGMSIYRSMRLSEVKATLSRKPVQTDAPSARAQCMRWLRADNRVHAFSAALHMSVAGMLGSPHFAVAMFDKGMRRDEIDARITSRCTGIMSSTSAIVTIFGN